VVTWLRLGDLTQFKQLFNRSVRKKMTNDHLWVIGVLAADTNPVT